MKTALRLRRNGTAKVYALGGRRTASEVARNLQTVRENSGFIRRMDELYTKADNGEDHAYSFGDIFKKVGSAIKSGVKAVKPLAPMLATAIPVVGPVAGPMLTMAANASAAAKQAKEQAKAVAGPLGSVAPGATKLAATQKAPYKPFSKSKKKKKKGETPEPNAEPTDPAGTYGVGAEEQPFLLSSTSEQGTEESILMEPTRLWSPGQGERSLEQSYGVEEEEGPGAAFVDLYESYPESEEVIEALEELEQDGVFGSRVVYPDMPHERCAMCRDASSIADWDVVDNEPEFKGSVPLGTFYKSPLVSARVLESLGGDIYGQVKLSEMPFPIEISASKGPARAYITLAHEMAHVGNKLYKWNVPHHVIHEMGVHFGVEGMAVLLAYLKRVANSTSVVEKPSSLITRLGIRVPSLI